MLYVLHVSALDAPRCFENSSSGKNASPSLLPPVTKDRWWTTRSQKNVAMSR